MTEPYAEQSDEEYSMLMKCVFYRSLTRLKSQYSLKNFAQFSLFKYKHKEKCIAYNFI